MELTELQDLECAYAELHKDVYGVKARWYRADSVEQARKDLDALQAQGELVWAEEAKQQAERVVQLEARIEELIKVGARNRETALRWIHEAEGSNGDDEYLCWTLGIPYGYFKQAA